MRLAALAQIAFMIAAPLIVAAWFRARHRLSWRLFGYGAAAFVLSQVVHFPILAALPSLRHSPVLAPAVLGLLAGLCEEPARYLMFRKWIPEARRWPDGVMAGLGHGGIESILLGLVSLAVFLHSMAAPESVGTANVTLGANPSPWLHLAGAFERVPAIAFHVCASLLVMRAVVRRRLAWLALAIALHALLDGAAVVAATHWGVGRTLALITAAGAVFAGIVMALREPDAAVRPDPETERARAGSSPLACFDLSKRYDERVAVDAVSFTLAAGEIVALLGPNGAGKTTTVRMLCGLIPPSSGTAVVAGTVLAASDDEAFRARIGILPEAPGLYERLTPLENLAYFGRLHGLDEATIATRTETLLRSFGLWDRRVEPVSGFSKGMKQKVAVARALLHEPDVLFLDEPTSGLDPEASRELRDQIRSLKSKGTTILLTTHRLEEAEDLADRIGILRSRLLAIDTVDALRRRLYGKEIVVRVGEGAAMLCESVSKLAFVTAARVEGDSIIARVNDPDHDTPAVVRALVEAGAAIRAVHDVEHSLEDMYLDVMRGAA